MKALEKIRHQNFDLNLAEIVELLRVDNESSACYELLHASFAFSRSKFGHKGYVFTQVGLNAAPCPINCKFCALGEDHYALDSQWEKSAAEVVAQLRALQEGYFDDFFLMTTADYPQEKVVELGKQVKPYLRKSQKLVANIGDFDLSMAYKLKEAGFTGAYHIRRLREGLDTQARPEEREATLEAIRTADLELYYCVEPIGPEHSYEEIAQEILHARDLKVSVMAAMRRVAVEGSPLFDKGQISIQEMVKIAAVANLIADPARAMSVHEPTVAAMWAGINQFSAEVGANPRDRDSHTEHGRGYSPAEAWAMLNEFGYFPAP